MKKGFWDGFSLGRAAYDACIDPVCRQYGLNRTEMDILLFLANNPQFDRAADVVERRGISKAHVSQSVRTLTERGMLVGSYSENNRRSIHLSLCPAAGAAVAAGQQAQAQFFAMMSEGFDAAELAQFRSCFERMAANAGRFLKKGEKN